MLDGGLSRVPQPVDRRTARRPESPRRQSDDQPTNAPEPQSSNSDSGRSQAKKTNKPPKKFNKWLGVWLAVLLVGVLAWFVWTSLFSGVASTIDRGKNQAVLLANGQTYFGKLAVVDGNHFKLSDIFYVQSNDAAAEDEEPTSGNMQLIKRGEEVFGPLDPMVISRDQIVYFENIKDDSQVSKLMKDYKAKN